MNLEQAMQCFLQESAELLEEMETILLDAEADNITPEQLGALFRSMHTIKGSAGLFGLDELVHFTHQAENLLDQLRDGKLPLDARLSGVLLCCHDHVKAQLAALAAGHALPAGNGAEILASIATLLQHCDALPLAADPPAACVPQAPANSEWLLSLRFGPDVLRNGMDPASFIRYLATLGEIQAIASCCTLPADEGFDPEQNYLRLELQFCGAVSAEQLESVFSFASDGSQFIISPRAALASHLQQALPCGDEAEQQAVAAIWQAWGLSPSPTPSMPMASSSDRLASAPASGSTEDSKPAKTVESKFIKVEASKLDNLIDLVGELVIAGAASNLLARGNGNASLLESTAIMAGLIEQIRSQTLSMRMVPIGETFSRFPRLVRDVGQELGKHIKLVITGAETELDKSMVDKLADPLTHLVRNAIDHGIESAQQRRAAGKPDEGHVWLNAYHESGSVVIEVADDGGGLDKQRILAKARHRGIISSDASLSEQDIFQLVFAPGFSTAEQISNLSGRGVGLDVVRKNIQQLRGTVEIDSEEGWGSTFRLRLPLTLAIIDGFLVEIGSSTFIIPLESVVECMELPTGLTDTAAQHCLQLRGEILPLLHLRHFFDLPGQPGRRRNVVVVQAGDSKAGLVVDTLHGEFQTVIKPLGSLFRHLRAISGSTILGSGEVALILDVPALIQHLTQQESEHDSLTRTLALPLPGTPDTLTTSHDRHSGETT